MRIRIVALITGATLAATASNAAFAPFTFPDDQVRQTLHVDGGAAHASDANPGTEALPFRTISGAFGLALTNKAAGIGTRILIEPGVYRETIEYRLPGY